MNSRLRPIASQQLRTVDELTAACADLSMHQKQGRVRQSVAREWRVDDTVESSPLGFLFLQNRQPRRPRGAPASCLFSLSRLQRISRLGQSPAMSDSSRSGPSWPRVNRAADWSKWIDPIRYRSIVSTTALFFPAGLDSILSWDWPN
jgi:hypothetical protein